MKPILNAGIIAGATLIILSFVGCQSTPQSRINANPAAFAQLTPEQQAFVEAGRVSVGMTPAAVTLALGNPDHVTIRTTATGETQVWHYYSEAYYDGVYLYGGGFWGPRGRRGWRWGGEYAYVAPVRTFQKFRVEFRNGAVTSIQEEMR